MKNKHGNHSVATFNPHPYVHLYLQQQPNAYPERTPEIVANNTYYTKEIRAPTKISVGPNLQRAPTTVSIPPLYGNAVQAAATHQHTSNPHPHVHPYLNHTNHSTPSWNSIGMGVNMGRKQELPQKSVLVLIMNQLQLK